MREMIYTAKDPRGLPIRTAQAMLRELRAYSDTSVTLRKGDRRAAALSVPALLGMGLKRGDAVTVTIEGAHEDEVAEKLDLFYKTYF